MNTKLDPRIVSEIADLFDEMMQMLGRASDGGMVRLISKFELTLPQLLALEMMKLEPQTVSSLAAGLQLTASAVSRMVDQLVHKKLVSRVEGTSDRRKKSLNLTAFGRRAVERLLHARNGNLTRSVSEFDSELGADFKAVLERIVTRLRAGVAQSGRTAGKSPAADNPSTRRDQ